LRTGPGEETAVYSTGAVLEETIWGGEECPQPRRRVASAEGGKIEAPKAPSQVRYAEGCHLPSQLEDLASVVS